MKIHFLIRTVFGEDACIDRFTDEAEYVEKLRETMRSFYETGDTDRCWDSAKIDGYTSDVAHPTEHMEAVFSVWVEECNHQAESWHYGTVEVPDPKRWFVTSDTDDGHTIITFHSEADMWKYIADLICRNLKPWNQLEELDEAWQLDRDAHSFLEAGDVSSAWYTWKEIQSNRANYYTSGELPTPEEGEAPL